MPEAPSQQHLYEALDKAWKSTCRVLFGGEIGSLAEFEAYLKRDLPAPATRASHLSGEPVSLANDDYCGVANFISSGEMAGRKPPELSINDIKDIDSVLSAISGIWEYAGNRVLGNSAFVERSDIVIDSQFVSDSINVQQTSYAYAAFMPWRGSKYIFGSGYFSDSQFAIRLMTSTCSKRCFECNLVPNSSDIYLSSNCWGCQELMFCFNLKNMRHCIGNLELPREKFAQLKRKLVSEIRDELEKNKRFPSIFELVGNSTPAKARLSLPQERKEGRLGPVQQAFETTHGLIFGAKPGPIDEYGGWLLRHTLAIGQVDTPFGRKALLPRNFCIYPKFPRNRIVSHLEAAELGKLSLAEEDLDSLEKVADALPKIGFFTAEWWDGVNDNILESTPYNATNAYRVYDAGYCDRTAFCSLPLGSKFLFGCHRTLESEFCINCYNSLGLRRCFEMDSCTKCSDSLFCHNSEALQDAMFCFNAKGKRHAIGNAEVGPEKYKAIKGALLQQMNSELEKKRSLELDIFNIGCHGKKGR